MTMVKSSDLLDLCLQVSELKALLQPLVRLISIELQLMLLLMKKFQQFLHLCC